MDKKSKILIIIFLVIVIVSMFITFYRYIILQDIVFHTDEETFQKALLEE